MKIEQIFVGLAIILLVAAGIVYVITNQPVMDNKNQLSDNISASGSGQNLNNMIEPAILGPHSNPTFTMTASLPSVPDKLMVYTLSPEISGKDNVALLAKNLGLNGDIREVSGEFVLDEGNYHFEVNNSSGRILYTDTSRWMIGNDMDKQSNLPSEDIATSIVKKYLVSIGLMPQDAVLREVSHPNIVAMDSTGNVVGVGFEDVKVSFSREINGHPVVGPGSKLDVELGGNGDVINLYKIWRVCAPYKELSIITPTEAYEQLKKRGLNTGIKGVTTASVDKIYLGYYMKGATEEQPYTIPAYVFEGEAKGETGIERFVQYIPASSELVYEFPKTI